jgi:hypothetical protein
VFVAGVVCPHPPLLFPEIAQRSSPALDELRTACAAALQSLLEARPDVVVCVGEGLQMRRYDEWHGGSMRAFGVDVRAGAPTSDALPPALTTGAWLLDRAGWSGPRRYVAMPRETTHDEAVDAGERLAAAQLRVGVLAVGDGSARRSTSAPGYLDERAEPFDTAVAQALGEPDPQWLADALPPLACAELWVSGRQAWQFLAGAAAMTPPGGTLQARLLYDAAPFGVGYFVAEWLVA